MDELKQRIDGHKTKEACLEKGFMLARKGGLLNVVMIVGGVRPNMEVVFVMLSVVK